MPREVQRWEAFSWRSYRGETTSSCQNRDKADMRKPQKSAKALRSSHTVAQSLGQEFALESSRLGLPIHCQATCGVLAAGDNSSVVKCVRVSKSQTYLASNSSSFLTPSGSRL